jgi:hypothetical protein
VLIYTSLFVSKGIVMGIILKILNTLLSTNGNVITYPSVHIYTRALHRLYNKLAEFLLRGKGATVSLGK